MRNKEGLAILKPYKNVIVLNRIRFEQVIRDTADLKLPPVSKTETKEMDMANKLIEQLTEKFDIQNFKDEYTAKLLDIIKEKAQGKATKQPPNLKVVHKQSDDLMSMLKESLESKGFAAFSPFYRVRRKRSDRTKEIVLPIFPGYVFSQFDCSVRLPILTTPGVVRIVGGGNVPEAVDDTEILSLQTIMKSNRPIQPWPFLRAGQQVRIVAGPLSGTVGTLLSLKDESRLVASITLLQRSVAVEIDSDAVAPISFDIGR